MPFHDTGDTTLFFTDDGEVDPVLFVHGWTCDSQDWIWQIPALRARHRVIAVDLRGHGRSTATREHSTAPAGAPPAPACGDAGADDPRRDVRAA